MITDRAGNREECIAITLALNIDGFRALDLGCGEAFATRFIKDVVLVDVEKRGACPDSVIFGDIRNVLSMFPGQRFGTAYLMDVPEHLTKPDGIRLLQDLESMCRRIVLFTPIGELWITQDDSPHSHRSGWTPWEVRQLGYTVWEWPSFHHFTDGQIHGAFWAWKDIGAESPTPEMISRNSKVPS